MNKIVMTSMILFTNSTKIFRNVFLSPLDREECCTCGNHSNCVLSNLSNNEDTLK